MDNFSPVTETNPEIGKQVNVLINAVICKGKRIRDDIFLIWDGWCEYEYKIKLWRDL